MRRVSLFVVTGALVLGACGGGMQDVSLPPAARADLHNRVSQIRTAAGAHDPDSARQVLIGLRDRVAELERSGKLSTDQGNAILAAATKVDGALGLVPTTTTTEPGEHGKGKGKDKHGGGVGED